MRREVSLEEISDGRLYKSQDMVRANCMDCKGCSDCCHGMGNTIQLDPLDIFRIAKNMKVTFEQLVAEYVELTVVDSLVLPSLRMSGTNEACVFLNEEGRCSIHGIRPGICRLFPLGRYYEAREFSYFLQIHECSMKKRSKIKVSKWIDTPQLQEYEEFVRNWHYLLKDIEMWLQENGMENAKQMSTTVLQFFYGNPYQSEEFYGEYQAREEKFRKAFEM